MFTFIAIVEKSQHMRLENILLGQLRMGEHQERYGALAYDQI